ncbi:MAG: hypothetical protein SF066_11020 [Thermoanaerobaculia bacterium]|nr:hypothetical protein [Thermoanaerobaculia bacterium]
MFLYPLTVLALVAPATTSALDLNQVLAAARSSETRLAAEAELAAAARELSLSRGRLLDAPTLTVETGPRFSPSGDDFDLALGLEAPLAADQAEHRAAVEALAAARHDLLAAADLSARLDLELAYVDAWEAAEAVGLAEREVETVSAWLAVVAARVAAGAEAAYETTLVASELQASRLALVGARERHRVTWAELGALAAIPAEPQGLVEPQEPFFADSERGVETSLFARAIRADAALERSLATLAVARAGSRWSVLGSLGREGEEEAARVGLGLRLPLSGQVQARQAALAAEVAAAGRSAELDLARLEARWAGARERLAGVGPTTLLPSAEVERALAALDARVSAGKDRPSQVLPLRRQLVSALATALTARAARLRASFEIAALTLEASP